MRGLEKLRDVGKETRDKRWHYTWEEELGGGPQGTPTGGVQGWQEAWPARKFW
jgi:hypothetical protein